jgi:hypothetical protein
MELPTANPETPDIYSYGFSKSLNKTEEGGSNSVVYDTGELTAAQTLQLGSLTAGSNNNCFKIDPEQGMWIGAEKFADAPFSVDMQGNAKVNSIRRKDYQWFTIFESIDNYSTDLNGGGSAVTGQYTHVDLVTGATSGHYACIYKRAIYQTNWSWSKARQIKIGITFDSVANIRSYFGTGECNLSSGANEEKLGFYLNGSALSGIASNGTSSTTVSLATLTDGAYYTLMVDYLPGTYAKFYVDGVYKGQVTTTLPGAPAGTDNSDFLMSVYSETLAASAKHCRVSFFDFWQEY